MDQLLALTPVQISWLGIVFKAPRLLFSMLDLVKHVNR